MSDTRPPYRRRSIVEGRPVGWEPNSWPQHRFCALGCYEALYGGAAGGGKTDALLGCALRDAEHPGHRALLLRRTFPELEMSLIERARHVIPRVFPGARYNSSAYQWRFPAGGVLRFGYLEHEDDVEQYQSSEWNFIGFDELTHFSRRQYTYMQSRLRSAAGLPVRLRAGTNPGGPGHAWVQERWAPWLAPEGTAAAQPGEVIWYVAEETGDRYVPRDTCDAHGNPARGRCFVPARVVDNPDVPAQYISQLDALDPVTRAQLRDGDWLIRPAAGLLFKRAWFPVLDVPPAAVRRVRRWDFAATESRPGRDPDWTVGALWGRASDGLFAVEDVVRMRGTPLEVEKTVLATAQQDGKSVAVGIPQDPGAAGVAVADSFVRLLAGYEVRVERETGSKVERAKPASAQAERQHIRLVRGDWNFAWLQEHEAFPDGAHDDQVDTSSGAIAFLASGVVRAPLTLPAGDAGRASPWAV